MALRTSKVLANLTLKTNLGPRLRSLVLQRAATPSHSRALWLPNLPGAASALSPPVSISTQKCLPYAPRQVFGLIANIDAYSTFVPYCSASRVTLWTDADPATGERWPARADLTAGWGPFTESYTSRVYCVSDSIVEAVSGAAQSSIPTDVLAAHGRHARLDEGAPGKAGGLFESLVTRWTVKPAESAGNTEASDVTLSVRFQFANPALGFAAGNMADEMAEKMVQAFEQRARTLFGAR